MRGNFYCTNCGTRYDFHPGRCSNCQQVTVVYDGKENAYNQQKNAEAKKTQTQRVTNASQENYQQKKAGGNKSSSGAGSGLGVAALLAIAFLIYKGNSKDEPTKDKTNKYVAVPPVITSKPRPKPDANLKWLHIPNSTTRKISLNNQCEMPVRLLLRYRATDGNWTTNGFWDCNPKKEITLSTNKQPIMLGSNTVYFYAYVPGYRYYWTGDHEDSFDGANWKMRPFTLTVNGSDNYELKIDCNNFQKVTGLAPVPGRYVLGIQPTSINTLGDNETGFDYGVLVTSVNNNMPAEKAGIEEGDILLLVDNQKIINTGFLNEYLTRRAGSPVTIVLYRNDSNYRVQITPVLYYGK